MTTISADYTHVCTKCKHVDSVPLLEVVTKTFDSFKKTQAKQALPIKTRLECAAPTAGVLIGATIGLFSYNDAISGIALGAIAGIFAQAVLARM